MEKLNIWDGFVILGFLIGSATAYMIKGFDISTIQSIALSIVMFFHFIDYCC